MSSQAGFGSNMLFQNMNDDLNASLAAADELSREFNSLLKEASSNNNNKPGVQTSSTISKELQPPSGASSISNTPRLSLGSTSDSFSSKPLSSSSTSFRPIDSGISISRNAQSSSIMPNSPHSSPNISRRTYSPLPRAGSDSYSNTLQSSKQSSRTQRASSPVQTSYNMLNPYDNNQMGPRSPRQDRGPSPLSFRSASPMSLNQPASSTLPRNFARYMQSDEGMQRQKSPGRWNETDLDVSYEKKPHHTYDKTEWLRSSVPNSSWRESNLDGPPLALSPKKNIISNFQQGSYSSLPRNACISVPPDISPQSHSPFYPQPIISRISVPPISPQSRQHKPIPLSVILRLQNPHWGEMATRDPRVLGGEGDAAHYQPVPFIPRELFHQLVFQPPELRQPAVYSDALNPGDVDAELERVENANRIPVILDNSPIPPGGGEIGQVTPRPLSPTRLQPVVAPEAQNDEIPNLEELLRIRAEIPRALKRRGSVDQSRPLKKASLYQPNQYKNLIDKLFRKNDHQQKGEQGSETNSSSDGEDSPVLPAPKPPPQTSTVIQQDVKNYASILRRSNRSNKSGKRAHLSPLVLLLDGALQGELETVQRAVQQITDPSQPNDEGITGLHNSICAGHYNVVEFLVRIGANVSSPDSHGWTPLHCAASCNDRDLCEFLVRSGAAVMARTESDGATASQKCDPYAQGFVECESFLKGVEEAMGVENSGVLYALWSYPAQAADELTFREGDMVTILQKPEGSDWWWASLCGREGFVPNNYFGLFSKIRPKSLC
ncbi:relA-associated inhibitor isoform X2 [Melanotaenia boesemani]|uniref:relA-associated inhibitor isoform X2 n=1 Tax=Melanotaenia boesemani TaxID=1250792 RepID=UPI001C048546|nr:relA-associated inhibitor isoform X2 [Melanotaenia boesemani]